MTSDDLVVIIPSRGRPESVEAMAAAFRETGAENVSAVWVIEDDDPAADDYATAVAESWRPWTVQRGSYGSMAAAIQAASRELVSGDLPPFALAVLNDDHRPRSQEWHTWLVNSLRTFHPAVGMVYPNDGYQGKKLSTVWAVTSSWVRTIGRMIPARVSHLYADNAMLDLATAVGCVTYLPGVDIIHEHPAAGLTEWTPLYRERNSRERYREDRRIFRNWQNSQKRRDQIGALRLAVAEGPR